MHYKLNLFLNGSFCSLHVFVAVTDVVESVSVMEGDSVTLHSNVTEIQKDDVIQWFGDQGTLIADLTR